ncbi:uncharacterized protein LOC110876609 [Helianthus annuus]|uniref:uncharacterized protein LOC110876609 n=1 Tax=Helianthus annuus TaxID=4232 RepID=UPI000B8FA088|nr:uncharacterized protein LOC110876609 [Helianthus annuus]
MGVLKGSNKAINVINVYAPQNVSQKKSLWDDIGGLLGHISGWWVILGDFNAVCCVEDRLNSKFNKTCGYNFNNFINDNGLREFEMKGKKFTFHNNNNGNKHSNTDRVLVYFDEVIKKAKDNFIGVREANVRLTENFKRIREGIKIWKEEVLYKEEGKERALKEDLEKMVEWSEARDLSEQEEWIKEECIKDLKELEDFKNKDLKQRARIKWDVDGDENSGFFHGFINSRRASNNIPGLMIDGDWTNKPSLENNNRPKLICHDIKRLSEENATFLTAPFKNKEIKKAVFECGGNKAPGPDGFNFNFIKSKGSITKGCSSSFITLIPNNKDPVGMRDYCPINLIGVISKTISMVLANRLKRVIGTIISDNQKAFLKGRLITTFVGIFLLDIMSQMGFPLQWCKWVEGVLASASSAVLVNGSPTFEFGCSKGIRQGDSPFLFILVMESLSSILCKAGLEGFFKGIQTPNMGPVRQRESDTEIKEWHECQDVINMVRLSNDKDSWKWNTNKQDGFSERSVKKAIISDRGSSQLPKFEWSK